MYKAIIWCTRCMNWDYGIKHGPFMWRCTECGGLTTGVKT